MNSFFKLCLFGVSFILSSTLCSGQSGDSIKPLRKINKEFLVVAHIVYSPDTVAGIDPLTISNQLAIANSHFAPIGVSFTLCETRYIYNFQFDSIDDRNRDDLLSQFWLSNRINMFFVSELNQGNGDCGNATFEGIICPEKPGIVIKKSFECLFNSPGLTITHELGHYFGLEHTFENNHGLELVDGSNCATAGDGICDTPADPYTVGAPRSLYVFQDPSNVCTFRYQGQDANGDYYNPDLCNIMSYYFCGSRFSQGQYERMVDVFFSNPFHW